MDQSMEESNHANDGSAVDRAKSGIGNCQGTSKLSEMDYENKKAAIHAEMERVNMLPSNSNYAVHRMKVLNKILHLLSTPRTISQDEELELLMAGLSL